MRQIRGTITWWLIIVPDIILLYVGLFLALTVRFGAVPGSAIWWLHVRAFTPIFVMWLVILFIHNYFDVETFRHYTSVVFRLLSAMTVNLVAAAVYFYFQPSLLLTPRRILLLDVGLSFILLLAWHLAMKIIVRRRLATDLYLFSFDSELAGLQEELARHEYLGFRVRGHITENDLRQPDLVPGAGILLPDGMQAERGVVESFFRLRSSGIKFYNHRQFYESLFRRVYLPHLDELWFLENIYYEDRRFYNLVKRIIDIICGLFLAGLFVITLPFIALAIKLSSAGPVLFIQDRVGRKGQQFRIYKYRTMVGGGPANTWTRPGDPRITAVGKFLRRSRLDELPQFINLLLGNVSLVGPRPEQVGIVEKLRQDIPFYDERHIVKPGMTGWAQLHTYAGNMEETRLKLQYDLYYVKHRSLLFDLEIILKTFYHFFVWSGQ